MRHWKTGNLQSSNRDHESHGSWQQAGHEISARGGVFVVLPRALGKDLIAAGKEQTASPRRQCWNVALLPLCQRLPHLSSSGDTSKCVWRAQELQDELKRCGPVKQRNKYISQHVNIERLNLRSSGDRGKGGSCWYK